MQQNEYKKLFEDFNRLNVLIIGDVMVDSYIMGRVERISPEAPVPVVTVNRRESRLGGAANVALNIHSLGANPILCSVIGDDPRGEEFTALLKSSGMKTDGIIESKNRITTTKNRIIGNRVQMLRVDEEHADNLNEQDEERLFERFIQILDKDNIDVIVFQDYDKGVITHDLIVRVVDESRKRKIPVAVDPKKKNFLFYTGVTLFKPNLKELKEGLNLEVNAYNESELKKAAGQLRDRLVAGIILITLSENGIFVDYRNGNEKSTRIIPSMVRSVSDVSGAGDTVISVASLCLALKVPPEDIALLSNLAGGIVCEHVGVVPINKEQLLKEILKLTA